MKHTIAIAALTAGALLGTSAVLAADADGERSKPAVFVADSAITTKVKVKLAAEHIKSLGNIHVDTDKDGVVWLTGTSGTREAADKAVSLTRETEGVRSVHSDIRIEPAK